MKRTILVWLSFLAFPVIGVADPGLAYLSERDPYYPGLNFPKLTTPMWVGEDGVEAVVLLSIDDMRDPEKYEQFLRPLLRRLAEIDGRAPVSIFTCRAVPDHSRQQQFLKEGLSLEIHTVSHPCPLLRTADGTPPGEQSLLLAVNDVVDCVRNLNQVPNNRPVAYRMPCCDSRNTVSPRFYSEIFPRLTDKGEFLEADSSIFMIYTAADKDLPAKWVTDADGRPKFQKYVPFRNFANTIENYPYPYVIDRLVWEFPCLAPSDWSAQNLQQPNNPKTVDDWKTALDITVAKQGAMTLVFHPHGWIKAEQLVELVDYADKQYGRRVKFLTFKEACDRLNRHLLAGNPLRNQVGADNGVRLMDLNGDGFLDVVCGNRHARQTRVWNPQKSTWNTTTFPIDLSATSNDPMQRRQDVQFLKTSRGIGLADLSSSPAKLWVFEKSEWTELTGGLPELPVQRLEPGVRFRDLNGDELDDLIANNEKWNEIHLQRPDCWWERAPFALPRHGMVTDQAGIDQGMRLVDLNADGLDDIVLSNERLYEVHLRESANKGWMQVRAGLAGEPDALPAITREGKLNGVWFHSQALVLANEFTAKQPDLIQKVDFTQVVQGSTPKPKSPEETLGTIQVADELQVDLVAAEPLIADPVAIAFDAHGKLWVVEMGDYPLGPNGGRIRVLQDTDSDGRMDTSVVFAELDFPTGVLPWRDGVLITAAPNLWYMQDTDGDLQADVKEILYTGFVEGNQQHRVNGLHYGIDGWVYGANGDSGGTIRSARDPNKPAVTLGRQDFRFRPDEDIFEKTSGTTQFGISFDDWGYRFGCNNRHHLMYYPLEDRYLKRNPHIAVPNPVLDIPDHGAACQIFPISTPLERFNDFAHVGYVSSACGLSVYRGDALPAEYQGDVFVCEPVSNLVHRDQLRFEGAAGMVASRADEGREFFASSDNWCRPVYTTTGPDGALYVVDMYRLVIEHPRWIPAEFQKKYDLRAGSDRGRIYRVRPKENWSYNPTTLAGLSAEKLVALLDHPNAWYRENAQMQLLWKRDKAAVAALSQLLTTTSRPVSKLHALWTLEQLGALPNQAIVDALNDDHPEVRKAALQIAESRAGRDAELLDRMLELVNDPSPRVRFQLALSLGQLPPEKTADALAAILLSGSADLWLRTAVYTSVGDRAGAVLARLLNSDGFQAPEAVRQDVVFSLVSTLAGRDDRGEVREFVGTLTKLASEPSTRPVAMTALSALVQTLGRKGKSLESWAADAQRTEALPELRTLLASAREIAADTQAQIPERVKAVRLLGQIASERDNDIAVLVDLVDPVHADTLQSAALEVLDRLPGPGIAGELLARWDRLTPTLRARVLSLLLSRESRTGSLLEAMSQGKVLASQLDAASVERLRNLRDASLREQAQKLLQATRRPERAQVMAEYREVLSIKGDASAGKEHFKRVCAACHQLGEIGQDAAPNLAESKSKTPEALLEAVLDPNKVVDPKYTSYLVSTVSGRLVTGFIKSETSNAVVLHKADGTQETVLRSEIEEIKGTGKSLMPEGLEKDLTPKQLADVIAFVQSSGPVRRQFPGNQPRTVTADGEGILHLRAANAEIYGEKIVFEPRYENLGYWSGNSDYAAWAIDVPETADYAVWLEWACDDSCAGNKFVIQVGEQTLNGVVPGTKNWDTYQRHQFGILRVEKGKQQLLMQPGGHLQGSLIDLKAIQLRPVSTAGP